jgi:hypothetical protein
VLLLNLHRTLHDKRAFHFFPQKVNDIWDETDQNVYYLHRCKPSCRPCYKVDTLLNLSLAANASSIKYALAYEDFDINGDYHIESNEKTFVPNLEWFKHKCDSYAIQDKKAKRNNLTEKDFLYILGLYNQDPNCYICHQRFTWNNKPTLDRINNEIGHTKDNVKFCCEYCNNCKSSRDEESTRLNIQLRNYALKYNLPMTLSQKDEYAYHILRTGITGGLSLVMHR